MATEHETPVVDNPHMVDQRVEAAPQTPGRRNVDAQGLGLVLGTYLRASPWFLGITAGQGIAVTNLALGISIFLVGLWALMDPRLSGEPECKWREEKKG